MQVLTYIRCLLQMFFWGFFYSSCVAIKAFFHSSAGGWALAQLPGGCGSPHRRSPEAAWLCPWAPCSALGVPAGAGLGRGTQRALPASASLRVGYTACSQKNQNCRIPAVLVPESYLKGGGRKGRRNISCHPIKTRGIMKVMLAFLCLNFFCYK